MRYVRHVEDDYGSLVEILYYCCRLCYVEEPEAELAALPGGGWPCLDSELDAPEACRVCEELIGPPASEEKGVVVEQHVDFEDQLAAWRESTKRERAWRWLAENGRRAWFSRLSDTELLHELSSLPLQEDPGPLLSVLERRVPSSDRSQRCRLAETLAKLVSDNPGPGRPAVKVDRAVSRLLPLLPDPEGRELAKACLMLPRRVRQMAAWKYYLEHGLDAESRDILAGRFHQEGHLEYRKLVAGDPELVARIGIETVYEACWNRYWRSKVVEAALASDRRLAERFRRESPEEWLWAVSRHGARDRLPEVLRLLEEHRDDVDLVNRVLLCVEQLGERPAIDAALRVAEEVLGLSVSPTSLGAQGEETHKLS